MKSVTICGLFFERNAQGLIEFGTEDVIYGVGINEVEALAAATLAIAAIGGRIIRKMEEVEE